MWPFIQRCSLADSGVFDGFTDWHSHILPDVDDGAWTMEEALDILALYEELGVKTVWLTPHVMEETPNTTAVLKARFNELTAAYTGNIRLRLTAEYMLDNLFYQRLIVNDLLPLGENADMLLVETSCFCPPMNFKALLKQIKSRGYYPVLAHPERYTYMEMNDYHNLKDANIRLQLNLFSLFGMYGPAISNKALSLLQAGMYYMIGTDTHSYDAFRKIALEKVMRKSVVNRLLKPLRRC